MDLNIKISSNGGDGEHEVAEIDCLGFKEEWRWANGQSEAKKWKLRYERSYRKLDSDKSDGGESEID